MFIFKGMPDSGRYLNVALPYAIIVVTLLWCCICISKLLTGTNEC